jgi:DNA ligase D-like protein (predicted polymerase)
MAAPFATLDVDGFEVRLTNPEKVFFPASGHTKLDLVNYYLAMQEGVLTGCRNRPTTMYRWPNGVTAPDEAFYQKRVPAKRPDWLETTTVHFPSGRSAEMLVITGSPSLTWAINLGCIDINPWPVRKTDVDHPDELRVDLDPTPEIPFSDVRKVAVVAHEALDDFGLTGYPKTSGKRGIHIYIRIEPRWTFTQVRRAALAFAREVERRAGSVATTVWWKEERRGVFVDYNQNARDRTIVSAYCVRPVAAGTVSCPLDWDEVADVDPQELRIDTVVQRFKDRGDPQWGIDERAATIESLLDLADKDENEGLGEAPWPPHFPKGRDEPRRVQPSRRAGSRGGQR